MFRCKGKGVNMKKRRREFSYQSLLRISESTGKSIMRLLFDNYIPEKAKIVLITDNELGRSLASHN